MPKITLEVENTGNISDGYHTFDELYKHRCLLFIGLMRSNPKMSWRANNHYDGSNFIGWFVTGMELPTGQISYHLPGNMWTLLDNCDIQTDSNAPFEFDGHTANDVLLRLQNWFVG